MPKVEGGGKSAAYFDLGDFTLDHVAQDRYQLHAKKKEPGEPKEITYEEAQAALRKWGIQNGLTTLPLRETERFVRQMRVADSYAAQGDETFARAFVEKAVEDAGKVGIVVDEDSIKLGKLSTLVNKRTKSV